VIGTLDDPDEVRDPDLLGGKSDPETGFAEIGPANNIRQHNTSPKPTSQD